MKQATIILAILLGFAFTSCDNGGDKTMYLQAQMVNHIGIAAFESEYTGTYRADAAVYEVVLDTENGKADVLAASLCLLARWAQSTCAACR